VIYLEPRSIFDNAIVQKKPVVYDFDKLIEVMMDNYDWGYIKAIDWYCYNIEPLKLHKGLRIQGD
jgi:hypothetical protein